MMAPSPAACASVAMEADPDGEAAAETMARHYDGLAGGDLCAALRMLAADRCADLAGLRRRRLGIVPQDDVRG